MQRLPIAATEAGLRGTTLPNQPCAYPLTPIGILVLKLYAHFPSMGTHFDNVGPKRGGDMAARGEDADDGYGNAWETQLISRADLQSRTNVNICSRYSRKAVARWISR